MSTSQMLKGILEGCLLAIISEGEIYGYEMSEKLAKYGFTMASEGKSVEDIFGSSPKVYVNELVRIGVIKLAILFVLVMIHTKLETRKVNI